MDYEYVHNMEELIFEVPVAALQIRLQLCAGMCGRANRKRLVDGRCIWRVESIDRATENYIGENE